MRVFGGEGVDSSITTTLHAAAVLLKKHLDAKTRLETGSRAFAGIFP